MKRNVVLGIILAGVVIGGAIVGFAFSAPPQATANASYNIGDKDGASTIVGGSENGGRALQLTLSEDIGVEAKP